MHVSDVERVLVCVCSRKKQTCVPVYLNSYNTCDVIMYLLRHCVVCYKLLCAMLLRSWFVYVVRKCIVFVWYLKCIVVSKYTLVYLMVKELKSSYMFHGERIRME